jgi:hypothetical protein
MRWRSPGLNRWVTYRLAFCAAVGGFFRDRGESLIAPDCNMVTCGFGSVEGFSELISCVVGAPGGHDSNSPMRTIAVCAMREGLAGILDDFFGVLS